MQKHTSSQQHPVVGRWQEIGGHAPELFPKADSPMKENTGLVLAVVSTGSKCGRITCLTKWDSRGKYVDTYALRIHHVNANHPPEHF